MATDYSKDPDFQYLAVDRKKLLAEQKEPFDGKKACWVPDEKEGFARAEIVSTKGEEVTVRILSSNEVGMHSSSRRMYGSCIHYENLPMQNTEIFSAVNIENFI